LVFLVASFPLAFPPKTYTYAFLFSPIRATCPAHLILLSIVILIILDDEYKSLSSSLCSFLHSPVISSLFGPKDNNYKSCREEGFHGSEMLKNKHEEIICGGGGVRTEFNFRAIL
jgi:hypothetical protein